MKYLFLLAGILAFGFVSAQKDEVYYLQKQIKKKLGKKITEFPNYQSSIPVRPQKEVTYILPDGNNVSVLPQDNMPCIKPDMSQFNMPDAGSKTMLYPRKGVIPNSVLKQRCW